jgi:hypothetical protein
MKRYLLPVLFLSCSAISYSQQALDALRYSFLQPGGSARYLGAGGAFGALGAEFSTLSENPAGLAMYRTNEFSVTPSLHFARTNATLQGSNDVYTEKKSSFGFDNIGLVFKTTPQSEKWKAFNIGIGLNRVANYNQSAYYKGSANGSILNGWLADANSAAPDAFSSQLAIDAKAFYPENNTSNVLTSDFETNPNQNPLLNRTHTVSTRGSMNELVFSMAGNYDEKLMIGGTIGVPIINYHLEGEYKELDPGGALDGNVHFFDNLTYGDYLQTSGVGINGKFGFIYKISQMFRIGGAIHTPTYLRLTDTYSNTLNYVYDEGSGSQNNSANSPDGTFDYRLHTPWRAIGSASVVFNKIGFISGDVEFVDYTANAFVLTSDVNNIGNKDLERSLNNEIQRKFQQAVNLRFGGELALDKFRLRAGLGMLGKPLVADGSGFNMAYSLGAGIRSDAFYLDLGYRRYGGKGLIQPYGGSPAANTDVVVNDILLTLGFKF